MSRNDSRNHLRQLLEKIEDLPPERVAEVEDFVDFLKSREREREALRMSQRASETVFRKIWDNADDAIYDDP